MRRRTRRGSFLRVSLSFVMAASFWGIEIKAGQTIPLDEDMSIHVSNACLGPEAKEGDKVFIQATVDEQNHVLGVLQAGRQDNLSLDLFFDSDFSSVTFSTIGKATVFLSGYSHLPEEGDEFDSEDEFGEFGEFGSEEDEEEDEEEAPMLMKAPKGKITEIKDEKPAKKIKREEKPAAAPAPAAPQGAKKPKNNNNNNKPHDHKGHEHKKGGKH
eukprot:TRINITY_DN36_c0_g1_i1.p1 TRINITY_DN36_c0_g1~~TRINITY_DN36_c0_g1_i1.p1  ORF type:complete len:214 (+),score=97.62 TRINITY_DN36_c0_g1_i1:462-1103(+)